MLAESLPSSHVRQRRLTEEFHFSREVARTRCSHLGSSGDAAMKLFVRNAWLDSGYMFCVSSGRFSGRIACIFFGEVDSDLEVSRSPCCCRTALCAARTWKSEHFFYEVDEPGSRCDDGWDGGVAGSLDAQVTCHKLVSVTRASLMYLLAVHIAHLNPSPKQQ